VGAKIVTTQDLTSLPLKNRIRTHVYLNLKSKLGLARDLALDALRVRRIADLPNILGSYGLMFRERRASMHSLRIPAENLALIRGPRMATDQMRVDIRSRSQELLTDEIVDDPSKDGTSRAMVTRLVRDELEARPDIRSVANLGAFVDNQTAYLAGKFPGVHFTSVDTMIDIAEINQFFPQRPNWSFKSGYALELLESGELAADLFFMTSTSVCFTHGELDAYCAALAKSAKIVIFNEPWWPTLISPLMWKTPKPENINPNKPPLGLIFFNYQHNYIHFLEKHGFTVRVSRIVNTSGEHWFKGWYTLQIIAERRP
jgi:hypothetical protein